MVKIVDVKYNISDKTEKEIGKLLKREMRDKGITQMEMGEKIEYTNLSISSWIVNRTRIPLMAFIKIFKILGYDIYIVKGNGNKNEK